MRPAGLGLEDYLAVIRRRRKLFLAVAGVLLLASVILAWVLPPVYQAQVTVLIKKQEIPEELVETTVTGYVEERIQSITARLLTPNKLVEIAQALELYPELNSPQSRSELVLRMLNSIKIKTEEVEVNRVGQKAGTSTATTAFSITFFANSAPAAQKGANRIAMLYLEENRKDRTEQTTEVTNFLNAEAERFRQQISRIEARLAAFKQEHVAQLPDQKDINLRLLEQTEAQLSRSDERIRTLEERLAYLQTQLSLTGPTLFLTTDGRGQQLTMTQQLRALQAEYAAAQEQYTDRHPLIQELKDKIAALEATMAHSRPPSGGQRGAAADNPAYIALAAQLEASRTELDLARLERSRVQEKLADLEQRLFMTPAVEREYLAITRDYQVALANYQEIIDKLQRAGLAAQLEKDAKGERFALLGEASLPVEPVKPNRLGILLLGFMLAFGGGTGSSLIAEHRDPTVRGYRGAAAIVQVPPLAGIPYIQTPLEMEQRRRRRLAAGVAAVAAAALALWLTHLY
ncbi:MAG: Wzz/FepE/Etk N-terminal domain-containing protein, partial [Pseudomonadota bacterium]|nr:Wzz/FepE/Etk N-terminal domain-containing protein [Pseudomonadota bacterium]